MIAFKLDHAQLASQALGLDCYSAPGLFWSFFCQRIILELDHHIHVLNWPILCLGFGPTVQQSLCCLSQVWAVLTENVWAVFDKKTWAVFSRLLLLGLLLAFLFLFFTPRIFLLLYHYFWQVTFLLGHTSTS